MSALVLICAAVLWSDGDSGRCVQTDGERVKFRLHSAGAGEVQPFTRCRRDPDVLECSPAFLREGPAATRRAQEMTRNGMRCEHTGGRSWDRLVVTCIAGSVNIGRQLVREGLAHSDNDYGDLFADEERQARRERRGVWR